MKISFGTAITLPSSKLHDDDFDVIVEADITPPDKGGLHCPPSGPIPEILSVVIDPMTDVSGTRYEHGEDVLQLLGESDIFRLEDMAVETYLEDGNVERGDQEPYDEDMWKLRRENQ